MDAGHWIFIGVIAFLLVMLYVGERYTVDLEHQLKDWKDMHDEVAEENRDLKVQASRHRAEPFTDYVGVPSREQIDGLHLVWALDETREVYDWMQVVPPIFDRAPGPYDNELALGAE